MTKLLAPFFALLLLFSSCAHKDKTLKVAATAIPHAEMLEHVKDRLAKEGVTLEVIVVDDFNIPNRALADGEVDANFFQHQPFLDTQCQTFHYSLVPLAKVHIEPMAIYSTKLKDLTRLLEGSTISLPNDPTNEARALLLLHNNGIITLDNPTNFKATTLNIVGNPYKLHFVEMDAALLARTLADVDAAIINTTFALQAGLNPLTDSLAIETNASPYANLIVIRAGDERRADLIALKNAMTSEDMRHFIKDKYKGAVIPAF